MFNIYLGSDNLLEFNGPTDVANQTAISGATVTASLFDDQADALILEEAFKIEADEPAAETTLAIHDVPKVTLAVGDVVRVELDDGTHHQTTVAAGSTTATIVLAAGLPSAASAGKLVALYQKVSGATVLRLGRKIPYEIGEQVSIVQADGTKHVTTVTDRDFSTNEITLGAATTDEVNAGALVSQKIGADITLSEYGTPVANNTAWGYRGTIADTHAGLKAGQRVRAEIDFNGGAGLRRIEYLYAVVTQGRF